MKAMFSSYMFGERHRLKTPTANRYTGTHLRWLYWSHSWIFEAERIDRNNAFLIQLHVVINSHHDQSHQNITESQPPYFLVNEIGKSIFTPRYLRSRPLSVNLHKSTPQSFLLRNAMTARKPFKMSPSLSPIPSMSATHAQLVTQITATVYPSLDCILTSGH